MSDTAPHTEDHHDEPHVVSFGLLAAVFAVLLVLTALTVGAWMVDLGPLNIAIAVGIAAVKASVVALYFMHLRWDNPFNGAVLCFSLVFVSLFIVFALVDTSQYQPSRTETGPTPFEQESGEALKNKTAE